MIEYVCLMLLMLLSLWDIKNKKVPVWILILFTFCSIPVFFQKELYQKIYTGIIWSLLGITGICIKKKKEWIGIADLWVIGNCAAAFSITVFNKGIFTTALIGAAVSGVLFWKNRDARQTVPFIPFIFGGIIIWYLWEKITGIWS